MTPQPGPLLIHSSHEMYTTGGRFNYLTPLIEFNYGNNKLKKKYISLGLARLVEKKKQTYILYFIVHLISTTKNLKKKQITLNPVPFFLLR